MSEPACPWRDAARQWPRMPGLITSTRNWTFAELEDEVARRASELTAVGWQRGERIGLHDRGNTEFILWLAAATRCGLVACLTSARWTTRQLSQAADCTGWRTWIDVDAAPTVACAPVTAGTQDAPRSLDQVPGLATILFSSGSSGSPKAIAHRLSGHLANAAGACENLPLQAGDVWPISLPMSHVSGLGILFRCLHAGAAVLLPEHRQPLEAALFRWNPSHLSLVPTQLKRLLDLQLVPPPRLRGVLVGGASLPLGLVARARSLHWPILTTYGLTEMASQVTATSPGADETELATCGRVLPGREVMVSGSGDILVRGSARFEGFVQDSNLIRPFDKDGWYATGDLGAIDGSGRLSIAGRLDQMFISGGENCYPEEIENGLLEIPGIHRACVVAVPHPEYGQRPYAFVDAREWSPSRWRAELADVLPRYKLPDHFAPWPAEMPLKPNRRQLAELAAKQLAQQGPTGDSP